MSAITTAQLVIYLLLIPLLCFILYKHGRKGLAGWGYLFVFFTLRIVGGAMALAGAKAATIVASIGVSPLLLAAVGVLQEARSYRNRQQDEKIERIKMLAFHLLITVGVALLASGAAGAQSSHPTSKDSTHIKIGVVLLTVAWAFETVGSVLSLRSHAPVQGTRTQRLATILLYTVIFCNVFIGIRVIYTLIAMTTNSSKLNPNTGLLSVRVVLSLLPELIATVAFLGAGFYTKDIKKAAAEDAGYSSAGHVLKESVPTSLA